MIKDLYNTDPDLSDLYQKCLKEPQGMFSTQEGFMFKGNKLCIPKSPLRYLLVKEVHEGALGGHFGIQETLDMLAQHFVWLRMLGTVGKYVLRCEACIKAKLTFIKESINHYLLQLDLGNISAWTSLLHYLELKEERMLSWW